MASTWIAPWVLLAVLIGISSAAVLHAAEAELAPAATFYVAPDGNDAFSGRLPEPNAQHTDGPFATLKRARDAVRRLKTRSGELPGPVHVLLRGGVEHFLAEPLELGPEDSGTAACPVVYGALGDEPARLTGGVRIEGWRAAGDGTLTVELPEVKQGRWHFRQLFVRRQGEMHYQRRYRPEQGAFVTAGLTDAPTRRTSSRHAQSQQEFRFHPGDIRQWKNLEDVEIVALHDWSASRLRIAELDLKQHVVRFTGFPVYRIGHWYGEDRNPYFAENVAEAFGRPGRWYLDRSSGRLSYRLLPDEHPGELLFVAPRTERLVVLRGDVAEGRYVEHVVFRRLAFTHTHWALPPEGYGSRQGMIDLPAAVDAAGARRCRFERCTFAHLGGYALRLGAGCHENQVIGCRMFDLGGGGVMVGVTARNDPPPITPTGNVIANSVISDGGLVHYSAHGIWVGIAVRTRVSHNVVRRFLYSTVSAGWSWNDQPTECRENVIEWNHIHDAMMLLADGGGIYTLGFQPGTVLRGNHIHAVHRSRFAGRAENNGIFFDQGSKGFLVEQNVIYDTANRILRYNQCQPEWHTFRGNVLGTGPDEAGFPKELVARAGLEPAWQEIDTEPPAVTPTPILSLPLPTP